MEKIVIALFIAIGMCFMLGGCFGLTGDTDNNIEQFLSTAKRYL